MSQSIAASEAALPERGEGLPWQSTLGWMCLVFAHGPLLYFHFSRLLIKPHYQFAVLLPLVVLFLGAQRSAEFVISPPKGRLASLFCALSSLGLLAAATLAWSPFLGAISALYTGMAVAFALGGWRLVRQVAPLGALACCMLPLPFDLDETIVTRLRDVTTRLSSHVLDQIGVYHLRSQNVIQLPGRQLFVADACSGIHSLFVLLTLALAWAVWMRRTLAFTLALLACAFGLVFFENISRVVFIVVAASQGNTLFLEGTPHTALGAGLFGISSLLVMSADQFLEFVWPRFLRTGGLTAGIDTVPVPPLRASAAFRETWAARPVTAVALLALGCAQLWIMPSPVEEARSHVDILRFPDLGETALPEKIAGYTRTSYKVEHRMQDDPMGAHSQMWEYRSGTKAVVVSLDYPYFGLHDASDCYRGLGWTLDQIDIKGGEKSTSPYVEVKMSRSLYGEGWLMFSQCDRSNRVWIRSRKTEARSLRQRLLDRVTYALGIQGEPAVATGKPVNPAVDPAGAGPWYQVHLLTQSAEPLTGDEQTALRTLFLTTRERLHERCGAVLAGGSGP